MKNLLTLIRDKGEKSKNLGKKKSAKLAYKMADCRRLIQKGDCILGCDWKYSLANELKTEIKIETQCF